MIIDDNEEFDNEENDEYDEDEYLQYPGICEWWFRCPKRNGQTN